MHITEIKKSHICHLEIPHIYSMRHQLSFSWYWIDLPKQYINEGTWRSENSKHSAEANHSNCQKYNSLRETGALVLKRWEMQRQTSFAICWAVNLCPRSRFDVWTLVYIKIKLHSNFSTTRAANEWSCALNPRRNISYEKTCCFYALWTRKNRKCFMLTCVPLVHGDNGFRSPDGSGTSFSVFVFVAIATSKAQGQSLGGALGIDFHLQCFTHGKLHVRLSGIPNPSKVLYVELMNTAQRQTYLDNQCSLTNNCL